MQNPITIHAFIQAVQQYHPLVHITQRIHIDAHGFSVYMPLFSQMHCPIKRSISVLFVPWGTVVLSFFTFSIYSAANHKHLKYINLHPEHKLGTQNVISSKKIWFSYLWFHDTFVQVLFPSFSLQLNLCYNISPVVPCLQALEIYKEYQTKWICTKNHTSWQRYLSFYPATSHFRL